MSRSSPATALPTIIDWPRDEAAHDGMQWEVWWFTTVLKAGDRRLTAQAIITHVSAGVSVILTVTDLDSDRECSVSTFETPDSARLSRQALDVTTEHCSFDGSFDTGYHLRARLGEDCAFDLVLTPTRPVLYNAGSGTFMLQGTPTLQYSIGALEAQGTVRWFDQDLTVSGHGWHDRQWEVLRRNGQPEFTWFGISLENGDTLSFYHPVGGHGSVTIMRQDGTHIVTLADAEPADIYPTGRGRMVPKRWTLTISAMQAQLTVAQRRILDNQNLYTGAVEVEGTYEGQLSIGRGFCDMSAPLTQNGHKTSGWV